MSRLIFVNTPLTLKERFNDLENVGSVTPPLNLLQLAAVTRKYGYETKIVDGEALNLDYEQTVRKIINFNPKYVALSATTFSIYRAAKLTELIKKKNKDIVIIIGGIHLVSLPVDTMKLFAQFDIGIIGEGEITLIELLKRLDLKKSINCVKGIIYRNKNKLIVTDKKELIKNLDNLPIPAWDLLEGFPKLYSAPFFSFVREPSTSLITSRGCNGDCIFCNSGIFGKNYRSNSPEYILSMIRHLVHTYGIKHILFYDDIFTINQKNLIKLCSYLEKEKFDLEWSCNARVDQVNLNLLENMKKAGCWQISYGIESGSQEILDFIKKGTTLEQIRNAISWTKKAGIEVKGYFIIGYPTETVKTIKKTIKFAKSLDLDDMNMSFFTPYPSLKIYSQINKYGAFNNDWKKLNCFNQVFVPKGLTKDKLIYYHKKALREFYLRPRIQYKYLKLILKNPKQLFNFLKTSKSFLKFVFKA